LLEALTDAETEAGPLTEADDDDAENEAEDDTELEAEADEADRETDSDTDADAEPLCSGQLVGNGRTNSVRHAMSFSKKL